MHFTVEIRIAGCMYAGTLSHLITESRSSFYATDLRVQLERKLFIFSLT